MMDVTESSSLEDKQGRVIGLFHNGAIILQFQNGKVHAARILVRLYFRAQSAEISHKFHYSVNTTTVCKTQNG